MKQLIFSVLFTISLFTGASAQSIIGTWKTIDDETGKAKSYVQLYEKGGKVFGKITKLLNPEPGAKPNPSCTACTDDRKGKKIVGLEIIRNMQKNGSEYKNGTILDPEDGQVYDCKIWIDKTKPNILNVRGYVAFFYRTQNWHRVK